MLREDCEGLKRLDIHDFLTMALYLGHCELTVLIEPLPCSFLFHFYLFLFTIG